ncbi:hypothetical protein G6F37_011855 [Rhizopus arrhizus]|nr:hypothetical protein G6F38_011923 [Rhizopus arrhizus]KAG1147020.1 hypothetical protein G6F37_011855 [Rhizopus arrhizus]
MDPTFPQLLAQQHHSTRVQNSFSPTTTTLPSTNPHHSVLLRPNSTSRPDHSRSVIQKRYRNSSSSFTRLLQLNICDTEKGQGSTTSFQLEATQPISQRPALQNGNIERGITFNTTLQLSDFDRSVRCLSPYPCSSGVSEVPSISLEGRHLSIPHHTFRPIFGPLAVYQDLPPDPDVGTPTRHTNQCLYRRLGDCSGRLGNLSLPDESSVTEIEDTGMEDQPFQIDTYTDTTLRPPRLQIEYFQHDSPATSTNDSRHSSVHPPSFTHTHTNASGDSQSNDADSGGYICSTSGAAVHSPVVVFQEPDGETSSGLGHPNPIDGSLQKRAALVVRQPEQMERSIHSSNDANRNYLCGRERFRLGVPLPTTANSWILDSPRITDVDQLEGIKGSISCPTISSPPPPQNNITTNRQHNVSQSHQQVWGDSSASSEYVSNGIMDMMSTTGNYNTGSAYSGKRKCGRRSGITAHIHEESVADPSPKVSATSTTTGLTLRRSVCGQDDNPVTKIRHLETGPWGNGRRCVQFELDTVPPTLGTPAMEPHYENVIQDSSRPGRLDNSRSPELDRCAVVV